MSSPDGGYSAEDTKTQTGNNMRNSDSQTSSASASSDPNFTRIPNKERPKAPPNTGKNPEMHIQCCDDPNYVTRDSMPQVGSMRESDYGGGPVATTAEFVRKAFDYKSDLRVGWSHPLVRAAHMSSDHVDSGSVAETVLRMLGLGYDIGKKGGANARFGSEFTNNLKEGMAGSPAKAGRKS